MSEHGLLPRLQGRLARRILAERAIQPQSQRLDPRKARWVSREIADMCSCRSARRNGNSSDHPDVLPGDGGRLHVSALLNGLNLVITSGQRGPGPECIVAELPDDARRALPSGLRIRDRAAAVAR